MHKPSLLRYVDNESNQVQEESSYQQATSILVPAAQPVKARWKEHKNNLS